MMRNFFNVVKKKSADLSFRKSLCLDLKAPIVSFTFDDAPHSAFAHGGAILEQYQYGGTYYIALSFLDSANTKTHFTKKELERCLKNNHELACHTFNHVHFFETRANDVEAELDKNQAALQQLFPQRIFENFAYPFGEQSRPVKRIIGKRFCSARGIDPGINCGKTDLNNLKAIRLYEAQYHLAYIYQKIEEAIRYNGWLIFYTHDIQDDYSRYGCSPLYFEAVTKKCFDEGIKVLNIKSAIDFICREQPGGIVF